MGPGPASTPWGPGIEVVRLGDPRELLAPAARSLRAGIVEASDAAFGRPTADSWGRKFTESFLGPLSAFFVLRGPGRRIVGWSCYRATTMGKDRVVYFGTTGIVPDLQGLGVVPALQRQVLAEQWHLAPEARRALAVRTRSPWAYHLMRGMFERGTTSPGTDGRVQCDEAGLVSQVAAWLELSAFDPATGVQKGAYAAEGGLYGVDPRSGEVAVNALFGRLGPEDAVLVLTREAT
jgi:hypothetical protein